MMSNLEPRNRAERRAAARSGTRKKIVVGLTGGAALAAGGTIIAPSPASGATFSVSNTNDAGAGSLRQAILDANAAPNGTGPDVIDFGVTGTIALTTGQLAITDAVTITGPGAASLTVSGSNSSRIFYVDVAAGEDVTISGLTLTSGADGDGGALSVLDGDVLLQNLTISNNVATGDGGGLNIEDGVVNVVGSTISGNTAAGDGGGIYQDAGYLYLDTTTVSGNHATAGNGGGLSSEDDGLGITGSEFSGNTAGEGGGGVYVEDDDFVNITASRFTGNTAGETGGGIEFYDPDGAVTITDTTISGNTADLGGGVYWYDTDAGETSVLLRTTISGNHALSNGGGVYFYGVDDPVHIVNSTISGNIADGRGGGIFLYYQEDLYVEIRQTTISGNSAAEGGGVFIYDGQPMLIDGSIIANNTATSGAPDLAGEATTDPEVTLRFTLVETTPSANLTVDDQGGNVIGQDPVLGGLANNGGLTLTHLPGANSPARNAGDPAFTGLSTDQRGGPRVLDGRIDMGSVESSEPPPPTTTTTAPTTTTTAPATPPPSAAAQPVTAQPNFTG